ncbi:MAG: hypothetical protein ACJ8FY_19210 [Gemmataceae bacterium]
MLNPVVFAVLFVINTLVLLIAFYVFAGLMGDLDLGTLPALFKSLVLTLAVTAVQLFPIGGIWLTIPIWLLGFVVLFQMEISNCWLLAVMVWGMSTEIRYFVLIAFIKLA